MKKSCKNCEKLIRYIQIKKDLSLKAKKELIRREAKEMLNKLIKNL